MPGAWEFGQGATFDEGLDVAPREGEVFEKEDGVIGQRLTEVHGVLVPGAFGERGSAGMIEAVRFAREHAIPYFGVCFGMRMSGTRSAVVPIAYRTLREPPSKTMTRGTARSFSVIAMTRKTPDATAWRKSAWGKFVG